MRSYKKELPIADLFPIELIRSSVFETAKRLYPTLPATGYISLDVLREIRSKYIQELMMVDKGDISLLEKEVVASIASQDMVAENINKKIKETETVADRLADKLAHFCGSWKFIIFFISVMIAWMILNGVYLVHPFDVYPYILLNLFLSCLAALQAPVILMSQNRQSYKDSLRADDDYRTNLVAELEIRQLNAKLDLFMKRQWERLLEVQKLQIDLAEDLLEKLRKEK